MPNLSTRLAPYTRRLHCHVCDGWAEQVDVSRSAQHDGYEVEIRCHDQRQHFLLGREEIRRQAVTDIFEKIIERATILTGPRRERPPVSQAVVHDAYLSVRRLAPPIPLEEPYRLRADGADFLMETPAGTIRLTAAMLQQASTSHSGQVAMVERELQRQLGKSIEEIWPPPQPTRVAPAVTSWPGPPEEQTTQIREQTVSLNDIGNTLERCRNLVSGLPIRTIFMPNEDYAQIEALVTRVIHIHGSPTVGGFDREHFPETGGGLLWRETRIQPVSRKPALVDIATFDLSRLPLIYVNQANQPMEIWPPWVDRTAPVTAPVRLQAAPHSLPVELPRPTDAEIAAMRLPSTAHMWPQQSTVTVGWGETIMHPSRDRTSRERHKQVAAPPPIIAVSKPATGRKIVIRKPS